MYCTLAANIRSVPERRDLLCRISAVYNHFLRDTLVYVIVPTFAAAGAFFRHSHRLFHGRLLCWGKRGCVVVINPLFRERYGRMHRVKNNVGHAFVRLELLQIHVIFFCIHQRATALPTQVKAGRRCEFRGARRATTSGRGILREQSIDVWRARDDLAVEVNELRINLCCELIALLHKVCLPSVGRNGIVDRSKLCVCFRCSGSRSEDHVSANEHGDGDNCDS